MQVRCAEHYVRTGNPRRLRVFFGPLSRLQNGTVPRIRCASTSAESKRNFGSAQNRKNEVLSGKNFQKQERKGRTKPIGNSIPKIYLVGKTCTTILMWSEITLNTITINLNHYRLLRNTKHELFELSTRLRKIQVVLFDSWTVLHVIGL